MIDIDAFYRLLNFNAQPKPPHSFDLENIGALLLEEEGDNAIVRFVYDAPASITVDDQYAIRLLHESLQAPYFLSTSRAGRLCAHFPCSGNAEEFVEILECIKRIINFLQTGNNSALEVNL
ncbi:MAG: hypothetical protein OXF05_05360 [Hyphomicrobiales bacterium]|nr:hypothetical protein [Hyphomicrobiales bacterium]MCY4032823.1 hypothetical protein [Hyphomicrobiales bacterium]MCY4039120.1 hypothetical protein [Hyphomicrobiales bacterium]